MKMHDHRWGLYHIYKNGIRVTDFPIRGTSDNQALGNYFRGGSKTWPEGYQARRVRSVYPRTNVDHEAAALKREKQESLEPEQLSLAKRMILSGGAIISEYPEGTSALPRNFAIRNRIVAGMCSGALIIEAAKSSGSLITAEVSLNENREVFAPPNSIFHKGSEGTNELIKNGAHLVTSSDDILYIFGIDPIENKQKKDVY